jgi:hypothetical protein
MLPGPSGQVLPQPFPEWFLTLAISPSSLVMLTEQLKSAIAAYEGQFGKIPTDPNFKIELARPPGPKA